MYYLKYKFIKAQKVIQKEVILKASRVVKDKAINNKGRNKSKAFF